jgi:membrane-anchored mycosin MYCP
MRTVFRRVGSVAAAILLVSLPTVSVGEAPAGAIEAYQIDPARDIPPPDDPPGPELPMKQNKECATSAVLKDSQFDTIPINEVFGVSELHKFARGDGQVVAVIDSGVQPVSRLPRLRGAGDYIMRGDGLSDCDHHGTLIAGIIAGQPAPGDGFIGVAPGVEIVSIRHTSSAFIEDNPPQGYGEAERSAANIRTLAKAIVHAANNGATVINLSITACVEASHMIDVRSLAGALYYASVVKNIVVISSAGNTGGSTCQENPNYDPANPADPRNWADVVSVSLPSFFSDLVLSVGGETLTGDAYVHSMAGPWVGVAAPAINVVSLDPTEPLPNALTNATLNEKGEALPLNGTSYAAAYVSGLAALIREKYPSLTSRQVVNRILKTAHTPSDGLNNVFGYGIVDAVAALTSTIPPGDMVAPGVPPIEAPPPLPPPPVDHLGRDISLAALGITFTSVFVIVLAVFVFRRPRNG